MHAVEITNVTKSFGSQVAVDDLSLVVPQNTIYGFIGPNGSGKTTTLRMIMRILEPNTGSIRVLGHDHESVLDEVTYLPEERMLYKQMTVYEVLTFFAQLKGKKPDKKLIDQWLEKMQLPGVGKKKSKALSKGMTQKIQLISSLITEPKLVLLDEPFSGLDPVNAVVLKDTVLDLRKQGTTVIFSTHDMSVAERMCDFIFMIYKGKKVLDGTLGEIQSTYATDTIRVKLDGDRSRLRYLPGVTEAVDHGNVQELRIAPGTESQAILREVAALGTVTHFEVTQPSLQDIFVRIASPDGVGEKVLA